MENLETLCLDNISRNLILNEFLWKKRRFLKIPVEIGQKIYENSFKLINNLNERDLNFFRKEIVDLKHIDLYKKQYKNIKYFDFLNGHNLENLIIGNIDKFNLINTNFSITTQNLIIGNFNYPKIKSLKKFELLLLTCKVENSINFELNHDLLFSNLIYILIKNSSINLKMINLSYLELSVCQFRLIKNLLLGRQCLSELYLNFVDTYYDIYVNFYTYMDCFKSLPHGIKELYIFIESRQREIFQCLPIVFENLKQLNIIYIDEFTDDIHLIKKIFNSLETFNSQKLFEINFTFSKIDNSVNNLIVNFFKKFSKLKTFHVRCENDENCLNDEIIYSILHCAKNLEIFFITFKEFDNISNAFETLLLECLSLKSMDIGFFLTIGVKPIFIRQALLNCRKSMEIIEFSNCKIDEELKLNFSNQQFSALKEFELNYVDFEGNSLSILLRNLENSFSKTLKILKFIGCNLRKRDGRIISTFLLSCNNLEEIDLSMNRLFKSGIIDIITGLEACKSSIHSINFSNCGISNREVISLITFLKKKKNLQSLQLSLNKISGDYLVCILTNLKSSSKYLNQFIVYGCRVEKSYYNKLDNLSKIFPRLDYFINGTIFDVEQEDSSSFVSNLSRNIQYYLFNVFQFMILLLPPEF